MPAPFSFSVSRHLTALGEQGAAVASLPRPAARCLKSAASSRVSGRCGVAPPPCGPMPPGGAARVGGAGANGRARAPLPAARRPHCPRRPARASPPVRGRGASPRRGVAHRAARRARCNTDAKGGGACGGSLTVSPPSTSRRIVSLPTLPVYHASPPHPAGLSPKLCEWLCEWLFVETPSPVPHSGNGTASLRQGADVRREAT